MNEEKPIDETIAFAIVSVCSAIGQALRVVVETIIEVGVALQSRDTPMVDHNHLIEAPKEMEIEK